MPNWFWTFVRVNWQIAFYLYWAPLAFCAAGYAVRTWRNFRTDVQRRDAFARGGLPYYRPTDTIGTLIGRALATLLPVANLFCALFDLAPETFSDLFKMIGQVFNQPLVPERPERREVERNA